MNLGSVDGRASTLHKVFKVRSPRLNKGDPTDPKTWDMYFIVSKDVLFEQLLGQVKWQMVAVTEGRHSHT